MATNSSRYNAKTWPYPRHEAFEKQLRNANAAWFSKKAYAVNHRIPYLLDRWEDWPNNIIVPEVTDYIQAEQKRRIEKRERFPLHKYIHHGLSSQAMLFNLVGPLITENDFSPLIYAFEKQDLPWSSKSMNAKFEVENRKIFNEDAGQPTSIDLVLSGCQRPLFIEAKLVEREFGGCSVFADGDCDGRNPVNDFGRCYLHHLGRKYWNLMEKHAILDGPAGSSPICPLAMYYQFFREVIFAVESEGDFVLIYDQRNPSFYCGNPSVDRGLLPFLITFLPDSIKQRIHSISIQQIITGYQEAGGCSWLADFQEKYAIKLSR